MMGNEIEQLQSEIDELSTLLAESFYHTIKILSDIVAINERKYYEGSHSRYVAEKSAIVAKLLDMTDADAYEIKIAGLLLDIGKIGFNDKLLMKFTSTMSQTEYELYKTHCKLGWEILQSHNGFENISKIILQHHERLNGTGFPNRLQGKEIIPGAAIVAVVDTFHSGVFKRNHDRVSHTLNPENYIKLLEKRLIATIEYINQKAGILFDSKVVEVFSQLIRTEFREMIKKTVWRLPINKLEEGMIIAEDYFNPAGLLISSKGEKITIEMIKSLIRFAESGEIPHKILVMK